ncbi:MAG: hypothetical protein R6V12_07065, partial [Candidatus Hydrogenedentota bacterium]
MTENKLPKSISIRVTNDNPVVGMAAGELKRYLERLTKADVTVDTNAEEGFTLGLMEDFPEVTAPNVPNPELDDA